MTTQRRQQVSYLCILPWVPHSFHESGEDVGECICRQGLLQCPENLEGSPSVVSRGTGEGRLQSDLTEVTFQVYSF